MHYLKNETKGKLKDFLNKQEKLLYLKYVHTTLIKSESEVINLLHDDDEFLKMIDYLRDEENEIESLQDIMGLEYFNTIFNSEDLITYKKLNTYLTSLIKCMIEINSLRDSSNITQLINYLYSFQSSLHNNCPTKITSFYKVRAFLN